MIREVLSQFHLPSLAILGLFLFLSVFLTTLFWVFRKSGDPLYRTLQQLPLQEDLRS
jgi:hypothetical protein